MKRDNVLKKVIMVVVIVVILASAAFAAYDKWYEWMYGGQFPGGHGQPMTDWYEISQWEIDVCFNWGGTEDPNEYTQNNVAQDIYHNLIISLQAEVSGALGATGLTGGSNLYETAWFVQPTDAEEAVNFEVYLIDDMGRKELVESASANYVNGFRGYDARESDQNYTTAVIYYWNEERERAELTVPFIE